MPQVKKKTTRSKAKGKLGVQKAKAIHYLAHHKFRGSRSFTIAALTLIGAGMLWMSLGFAALVANDIRNGVNLPLEQLGISSLFDFLFLFPWVGTIVAVASLIVSVKATVKLVDVLSLKRVNISQLQKTTTKMALLLLFTLIGVAGSHFTSSDEIFIADSALDGFRTFENIKEDNVLVGVVVDKDGDSVIVVDLVTRRYYRLAAEPDSESNFDDVQEGDTIATVVDQNLNDIGEVDPETGITNIVATNPVVRNPTIPGVTSPRPPTEEPDIIDPSPSPSPTPDPSPDPTPDPTPDPAPDPTPDPTPIPPAPSRGLNCLAKPSDCGYPDETNTGILPGTTLTPSGSVTVDTDGAVIENLHITGSLNIEADNVTIRNTKITKSNSGRYVVYMDDGIRNLQFEDCEIWAGDSLADKLIAPRSGVQYSFRRCNLSGGEDLIHPSSDGIIEDNYFHDLSYVPTGHNDTVQVLGGSNTIIRHNTMLVYNGPLGGFPGTGNPFNAAIMIGNLRGNFSNFEFSDNLVNGGNYTLAANWGNVDDGLYTATNIRVINNRIGCDFNFGVIDPDLPDYATVSGNVWDKNGRPVGGSNTTERRALCRADP